MYMHSIYIHTHTYTLFKKSNENKAGHEELPFSKQNQNNLVALAVIDECVCMYELFLTI